MLRLLSHLLLKQQREISWGISQSTIYESRCRDGGNFHIQKTSRSIHSEIFCKISVLNNAVKVLEKYPCGNTLLLTHITALLIFFKDSDCKSVTYFVEHFFSDQLIRRAPAVAIPKNSFLYFLNNKYLFWNYVNLQNKDRIFWKSEKKHYNFYFNMDKKLLHEYLLRIWSKTANYTATSLDRKSHYFSKNKVLPKTLVRMLEKYPPKQNGFTG